MTRKDEGTPTSAEVLGHLHGDLQSMMVALEVAGEWDRALLVMVSANLNEVAEGVSRLASGVWGGSVK